MKKYFYLAEKKTMDVKIEDGKLIIKIDMQEPTPSASGKTLVVATTHGNMTTQCLVNGKNLVIGLNAYIKKKPHLAI